MSANMIKGSNMVAVDVNLEDQIIRVQKNQVEFEQYLKEILKRLNDGKNKNI